jgi:hypothetical protein
VSNIWPYLAGILDGEGCICLYGSEVSDCKFHSSLQVMIYNTSLRLMRWLVKNVGGKYYTRTANGYGKKPGKTQYVWHPSGAKNREKFLLGVLPYLVIKEEQAKVALEFLRLGLYTKDPDARKALVARCIQLNRGEESVETNTLNDSQESKRESELIGDDKSAPAVTQTA